VTAPTPSRLQLALQVPLPKGTKGLGHEEGSGWGPAQACDAGAPDCDRAAFHAEMNRAVVALLKAQLPPS
jgi:hypothetical protein